MHANPLELLELIDTYAAARSRWNTAQHELASWAAAVAHEDMRTARDAIAAALGIPAGAVPALPDETATP